jgi:hypothetical protein
MKYMNSPIVVVHQGLADYLKLCLLKARQYNPSTPIVLIGNEENRCLVDIIPDLTHVIPNQDDDDILWVKKNYKHRSRQTEKFELLCLYRWFFVRDFMKQNKIERCLHIDSDVLLYCDVWKAGEPLLKYGMTLARWGDGDQYNMLGHTCFINDLQLLNRFCNMIREYYTDQKKSQFLDNLHAILIEKKGCNGAISDMTFLKLFYDENSQSIGFIEDIVNDSTFDNRVTTCEGGYINNSRLFKKRMKKILFENKIPYCWNKTLQKNIRFHSIHFHGATKYMMKYFFQEKVNYYGFLLLERITLKWRKIFR